MTTFDNMFQPIHEPGASAGIARAADALERAKLDLNNRGDARRLFAVHGTDLIWCLEWGWGVWDGTHYEFNAGATRAFEVCLDLQDIVEAEAEAWRDAFVSDTEAAGEMKEDQKRRNKMGSYDAESATKNIRKLRYLTLHKHAQKCGDVTRIEKAMEVLQAMVHARLTDMDSRPDLLCVRNGLVDLRRAVEEAPEAEDPEERAARMQSLLRPNNRAGNPTRVAGCEYIAGAECPKFQTFLDLIVPAHHMQRYLQRLCGQLIAGTNDYQIAILLQGEGANGKSTLINILKGCLGTYVASCKIEMFLATELRSSASATPDESDLPGARSYIATEPEVGAALSDAKVKAFTGGDARKSRALHAPFFEWHPTGVPVLAFNRIPAIKGDSFGTRRRFELMPFAQNLRDLPRHLQRSSAAVEAEMVPEYPGILNWLIAGLAESRALGGLKPPTEAEDLKEALMSASNPVGEFLKACTLSAPNERIKCSELHRTLAAWADDSGAQKWQPQTLRKAMVQRGYKIKTISGYEYYQGLRWNDEEATRDFLTTADALAARRKFGKGDER